MKSVFVILLFLTSILSGVVVASEAADQAVDALKVQESEVEPEVYSARQVQKDFRKLYDGEISAVVGNRVIVEFYSQSVRTDRFFYVYDRFGKQKGKVILAGQYGLRDLVKPVQTERLESGWYLRSKLKDDYNTQLDVLKKQLAQAKKKLTDRYNTEQRKMRVHFRQKRLKAKLAEKQKIDREVQEMHQNLKKLRKNLNTKFDEKVQQLGQQERNTIKEKIEKEAQYIRDRISAELSKMESLERQKVQASIDQEHDKKMEKLESYISQVRQQRLKKVKAQLNKMGSELAEYEMYIKASQQALARKDQKKAGDRQPSSSSPGNGQ